MVRIQIKGGVWKNTEDEILKAAVMKYGMNQWSRISSLLVRKSAKQCKARWYEWLDPAIKKTEWSREDEEKLLHLAKIMPCQWRTIAPMMGRTAAQVLEHYEQLLDAAQQPEEAAAAAAGKPSLKDRLDDPRRLRPGEIDPLPEAKPARPDPVDMDEDEKEQLSEARARLANTKGKKAKRKAREKQLEEARRLTVLQRQRELRAAGIEMKTRKRKREIDYIEEIPLERSAPAGFYSTQEEDAETAARLQSKGFRSVPLESLEGKSRVQVEAEERKKDAKRLKLFKETNLPEALLKINALNDPAQIARRMQLDLPAPLVSEQELKEIAKATGGNLAAALAGAATPMRGGATPAHLPARTPLRPDTVLRESQNLLAITQANSSLLGGANTPLVDSDFSGARAKSSAVATPNVLATPMHAGAGGATPMRGVPGTPMRDGLGINASAPAAAGGSLTASQAIAASRRRAGTSKLSSALSALPAPQNQFAIVLPDLPKSADADAAVRMEEDAEDALARAHSVAQAAKEAAWRAESQVIQLGLPRPAVLNAAFPSDDPVDMEVEREVQALLRYDAAKHPLDAGKKAPKPSKLPRLEPVSEAELRAARELVAAEAAAGVTGGIGRALSEAEVKALIASLDLGEWASSAQEQLFLPGSKRFGFVRDVAGENLLRARQQQFELLRASVQAQSKKASKLEQQAGVLVAGHQQINTKLRQEVAQVYQQLADTLRNQSCFQMLAALEANAIPARRQELQQRFAEAQEKERQLQKKFQLLSQQLADMQ